MKFLGFEITFRRAPHFLVVPEKQLSEEELTTAFAAHGDLYLAVQQLICTHHSNLQLEAEGSLHDVNRIVALTGAQQTCSLLSEDMARRKAAALASLRRAPLASKK